MNEKLLKQIISELSAKLRGYEDRGITITKGLISKYANRAITDLQEELELSGDSNEISVTQEDIDHVEYYLSSHVFSVRVGEKSISIRNKQVPRWLDTHREDISWNHWDDYETMLREQGRPKDIISANELVIDSILDYSGDPRLGGCWSRKGLVMGNVQSGKTQNYLGLINKAIDCGYKTIILLGGHLNDLRMQTQRRVDEGVLGWESRHHTEASTKKASPIGVGKYSGPKKIVPGTTTLGDFKSAYAGVTLTGTDPVIFTIKKNTSVMSNLAKWIVNGHGVGPKYGDKKLTGPLLLIDDEADYASINTKHHAEEVTKTNDCIRELLSLFDRNTYVGYTATPFANIFIDPDESDFSTEDDLFPSDFMVKMPVPDNYVGQDHFFPEPDPEQINDENEADYALPTVLIDDHEETGAKKKHEEITHLPDSLRSAVRTFLLVTATRSLRNERFAHNTMLVNTSHLTVHQNQLETLIGEYVEELKHSINAYYALPREARNRSTDLLELENTYKAIVKAPEDYEEVVLQLNRAISKMQVWAVNQSTKNEEAKILDYSRHEDNGLCAIVIGGHKLSRGLTLEGLTVSYFARNSKAYDTLMQMCRWFGYRPAYKDLCRVFLSEESKSWYQFIALSIRELYKELELMAEREATPSEFGLKVREHPGSLVITAKNKIGAASSEVRYQDLWGQTARRFKFSRDTKNNDANLTATRKLAENLISSGASKKSQEGSIVFQEVAYSTLIDYLHDINLEDDNIETDLLLKNIRKMEEAGLPKPMIAFFCNEKSRSTTWESRLNNESDRKFLNSKYSICDGISTKLLKRKLEARGNRLSVSSTNLGNPDDEKIFLSDKEAEDIRVKKSPTKANSFDYLASQERDFVGVIIYHFAVAHEENDQIKLSHGQSPTLGLSVSLPRSDQFRNLSPLELKNLVRETRHSYSLNKVALKMQEYGDYDEDD